MVLIFEKDFTTPSSSSGPRGPQPQQQQQQQSSSNLIPGGPEEEPQPQPQVPLPQPQPVQPLPVPIPQQPLPVPPVPAPVPGPQQQQQQLPASASSGTVQYSNLNPSSIPFIPRNQQQQQRLQQQVQQYLQQQQQYVQQLQQNAPPVYSSGPSPYINITTHNLVQQNQNAYAYQYFQPQQQPQAQPIAIPPGSLQQQQQQQQQPVNFPPTAPRSRRTIGLFAPRPTQGTASMFSTFWGSGSQSLETTPSCSGFYPPRSVLTGERAKAICPSPPNWEGSLDLAAVSPTNAPFIKLKIDPGSEEYKVIADMITCIHIKEIERVVNPDLWHRFVSQRKDHLLAKSTDLSLLKELGLEGKVLEQRKIGIKNFVKSPRVGGVEYSDNVALLYHCSKGNIQDILEQGLDDRLGGQAALMGRGIYFSDDPSKSLCYDTNDGQMMIFSVFLGDCLSMTHMQDGHGHSPMPFVREPKKDSLQQRSRSDLFFDSIVGRPSGVNEFVIYNRSQCCPLYLISYEVLRQRGVRAPRIPHSHISNDKFSPSRALVPPFAWGPSEEVTVTVTRPTDWPFLAQNVFKQMEKVKEVKVKGQALDSDMEDDLDLSPPPSPPSPPSPQPCSSRSALATAIPLPPPEGQGQSSSVPESPELAKKPRRVEMNESDQDKEKEMEDCPICCETPEAPDHWQNLNCCNGKLCIDCYKKLVKKGRTMSGVQQDWFKCPFCAECNGNEIGSCPNGQMNVTIIPSPCAGYEHMSNDSISIEYYVNGFGTHQAFRVAFLPNTTEGQRVLNLLGVAWDRRLCFSIGTSATTGRVNTVVWNIHHKTSLNGGVQEYGYPDPTYFDRVLAELKQYGIE